MSDCIFCKIVAGEIPVDVIYKDEKFIVFPDRNPVNPGHILLVPHEHTDKVFDINQPLYDELFQLAKKFAGVVERAMHSPRTGMVVEGFGVPHAHVHLIPIYEANQLDPNRSRTATPEELKETAEKIKAALKNSAS